MSWIAPAIHGSAVGSNKSRRWIFRNRFRNGLRRDRIGECWGAHEVTRLIGGAISDIEVEVIKHAAGLRTIFVADCDNAE